MLNFIKDFFFSSYIEIESKKISFQLKVKEKNLKKKSYFELNAMNSIHMINLVKTKFIVMWSPGSEKFRYKIFLIKYEVNTIID